MQGPRSPESRLKAKALACIAQREHSRVELRAKLIAYLDRQKRAAEAAAIASDRASDTASSPMAGDAADDVAYEVADDVANDVAYEVANEVANVTPADRDTAIEALLDWLVDRDLLSTERFVEGRVRARASRFGQRRVQQELARHGLSLEADVERELRRTEPARAQALWARRFGTLAADPAQRAKQMRFLLARGFDAEVARRVVSGTLARHEEDAGADGETPQR